MIAIGYARVSTEQQASDGVSLEAQAKKIAMQAELKNLDLMRIEVDTGSGKRADNREALQRVLAEVQRGTVAAVIVYALDRLTRNLADLQGIIQLFERKGVQLISVSESLDTGSAAGRMVVNILGVVAQWQREYISERTEQALEQLRDNGKRISNHVPFGWTLADNGEDLVPVEREQQALAVIHDLRKQGVSLREIGAELEDRGYKPKRASRWQASSLKAIIDRQARIAVA